MQDTVPSVLIVRTASTPAKQAVVARNDRPTASLPGPVQSASGPQSYRLPERMAPIRGYTAPLGQRFTAIGPVPLNPWNVQAGSYRGQSGWVRLECRNGERRPQDASKVNRIGLDGYVDKFPLNRAVHEAFSFIPGQNTRAVRDGQWLNFHEIHATGAPGDREQAGPLLFVLEWSAGKRANVFRISRNIPVMKDGKLTGITPVILYQGDMSEGRRYDFTVDFYAHPVSGYIRVSRDGVRIVDYRGPFGYGGQRLNFPQFRIYRAQRAETAVTYTRIGVVRSFRPSQR